MNMTTKQGRNFTAVTTAEAAVPPHFDLLPLRKISRPAAVEALVTHPHWPSVILLFRVVLSFSPFNITTTSILDAGVRC